ncbi:MAG: OsmC family protein [Burkholderiales bacterium]|nr:OsmC family protein [Burkholderiales bacterium]
MATQVISEEKLDLSKPIVRKKTLTAKNEATLKTVIDCGEFGKMITDEPVPHGGTGEGPSPLQAVLGALCGCESVTFSRTAKEMGFSYRGIEFEAMYTIDIRGRLGDRTVRPHFQSVRVQALVDTDEPEERLRAVVEETEARCPVFNLFKDANVNLQMLWVRRAAK